MPKPSILFVCLGNICRSPLAEGVLRAVLSAKGMAEGVDIDSAGTGAWHAGSAPDPRSVAIAARNGIDISGQRARKVRPEDFSRFELILGMDHSNVELLRAMAPQDGTDRVHLFLDFAGRGDIEVPDPYFGGANGFDEVYRMIRVASEAVADRLGARLSAPARGQVSSIT
jgi:protein-tyrosine phosphatase